MGHEENRVVDTVAIRVDQTVELTFKSFASDRCSMVARKAMYEQVAINFASRNEISDDLWEPILTDDDLLSSLILPILLVANRTCRILFQQITKVDDNPGFFGELGLDLVNKPFLAFGRASYNRYGLTFAFNHSSLAHTISVLAIKRLSM